MNRLELDILEAGLTIPEENGMLGKSTTQPVWLVRVRWRATSKTLRIPAKDEDEAIEKAHKLKECLGGLDFDCIGEHIVK